MLARRRLCSLLRPGGVVGRCLSSKRTELGIRIEEKEEKQYTLRQEYHSDPHIRSLVSNNEEATRVFSSEFGDRNDEFNMDLYNLWNAMSSDKSENSTVRACQKLKTVTVNHVKMKYLARKMKVDPSVLRGPQIKYHPHMQVRVEDRLAKNRAGREEIIWNKANYVRMKQAEYAASLGNQYDSYYVYKREIAQTKRLKYSRNNRFFRWVYYHSETDEVYELHGKTAAQMHRWTELKEERDTLLREIELEDILKYKHAIDVLEIPPIYIPTYRLPKPKWFRNHTISCLSADEVERLRQKRAHGAISVEEEEDAIIPDRPTKFNELISGWTITDQNVQFDSDFAFGVPVETKNPIPLPASSKKVVLKAPDLD